MDELLASLTLRVERLEAESAIIRLSADYCRGADRRDLDLFLSVWSDDAVWQVREDLAFTGHAEIRSGITAQWEATERAAHWTSNPSITVASDALSAQAQFDVHTEVQLPDWSWLTIGGYYEDEYVRVDDRWLLSRRAAHVQFERAG